LLSIVPSGLLAVQNNSGSTALHWAALNAQLEVAKKLVSHPDGPGRDFIDIKSKSGLSPLGEAEQAGWDEGAKWFVEMMNIDAEGTKESVAVDEDVVLDTNGRDIEVEIEDADGQVAKMTLSGTSNATPSS